MGDIVKTNGDTAQVSIAVRAPVGIVSVELRDATRVLHRETTYGEGDLGDRIRVMWSGAEYRGRGRNTAWHGRATLTGARIDALEPVNKLNPEMRMQQTGSAAVVWDGVTTGNMMGFDLRLANPDDCAKLEIATNHGNLDLALSDVGFDTQVLDAGGLHRKLEVTRLPNAPLSSEVVFTKDVKIAEAGDTPIWVCVTLEDGNQVWSSPMYLFQD